MIGDYGIPSTSKLDEYGIPAHVESNRIQAAALLVQDYSYSYSHWNAEKSLSAWLKQEGIPAIHGIDTRLLTKKIRSHGTMWGKIEFEGQSINTSVTKERHLVNEVSTKEVQYFGKGNSIKVLAVDCGIKMNMIRMLVKRGAEVKVVPWNYDFYSELDQFDGIFISNGPGDPTSCQTTIDNLQKVIYVEEKSMKPIFGICLGHQLLALASGGKTRRLPFGHRSHNQAVQNTITKECFITAQNHGYEVHGESLPSDWKPLFVNVNDGSNEGIMHSTKPFFSAQFHPEAMGGPTDTENLFDVFFQAMKDKLKSAIPFQKNKNEVLLKPKVSFKKVLLLGSGGLSIGQAGEFDYSGSQAIKALKEERVEVVLMNPNIASVQTNVNMQHSNHAASSRNEADQVYFLPITPEFVEEVIKKENPDGILISMGGQTALNCGVELERRGVFAKYHVKVMGTPIKTIVATEDRDIFNRKLQEIQEKIAPSKVAGSVEEAQLVAEHIGYPVMIRAAYALGGLGSGICANVKELVEKSNQAFAFSPQILIEKSLVGWKELEYEVVRDRADNCIVVCNMENFDPLGVHTGDSIVVAPSQTLSNQEYHMLRETAIKVVRHLGVIGECNIQFALHPTSLDYCIIEVNARLSRSSALASKATGYPLAFVAAKIALGYTLPMIKNSVTGKTTAFFEPSLDYVVTKLPKWDLDKFGHVSKDIGTAMKSVGEVMAIGRTWEESLQKAMRMVDPAQSMGFDHLKLKTVTKEDIIAGLIKPTPKRLEMIAYAFFHDMLSIEEISRLTNIDLWFLSRLVNIIICKKQLMTCELATIPVLLLKKAKKLGFSDKFIAKLLTKSHVETKEEEIRQLRKQSQIIPVIKQIDTLAGEYPTVTNYLYLTYHGDEDDVHSTVNTDQSKSVIVLGSGAYAIGSSVEFDWCAVSTIRSLRKLSYPSIMINYNPETVSTDYDECDKLYFEELSKERIQDIYEKEDTHGIIACMGGQVPNNIAISLEEVGINLLGTTAEMIDKAEDRRKFSRIIDDLGIQQAEWKEAYTFHEATEFANSVGFPVLIRPSYVLSGAAMKVIYDADSLEHFLLQAQSISPNHPVVISKFISHGREVEVDGVAQHGELKAIVVHEHVEDAGVHSGDAMLLLPVQTIQKTTQERIEIIAKRIAEALQITGPFNIQFIVKNGDIFVIECNLRASRSFPFISKSLGFDFIDYATKLILNRTESNSKLAVPKSINSNVVAVKASVFSFSRLPQADPLLGVEMMSTGEVAVFGNDIREAFLLAMMSAGFTLPKKKKIIFDVGEQSILNEELVASLKRLIEKQFQIFARPDTFIYLRQVGLSATLMNTSPQNDNMQQLLMIKEVDFVVNIPLKKHRDLNADQCSGSEDDYWLRRTAVDYGIPLITNPQVFSRLVNSLQAQDNNDINIFEVSKFMVFRTNII